jgi:oleate hydratase
MNPKSYLIGGGIASIAAAILLIRDAGWDGSQIQVFEAADVLGGSLDGSGNPADGYVIRGGRMFEAHFGCTFDLLHSIPTCHDPAVSVADDIRQFTQEIVTSSQCRLVINGKRVEAPTFELSLPDKLKLIRLVSSSERSLGNRSIEDYFSKAFFISNFWIMWSTMFAFQSWHSLAECRRYMRRFMHLLPGFNRLEGIHRTRLNQFDSIVTPCVTWLKNHGVTFHLNSPVHNIAFNAAGTQITGIDYLQTGTRKHTPINAYDRVFITLGSMTEGSSLGTMTEQPKHQSAPDPFGAWSLWQQIAAVSSRFGNPSTFAADPGKTLWDSFTVTLENQEFFDYMETFTGNAAGTGGLVTFKDSGWMLSVVLAHQPHFANQPEDTWVFWGYGLHPWLHGNAVDKPMLDCSGQEILQELCHQLKLDADTARRMFEGARCIPCHMPYITTQFMPRNQSDRPKVVPAGAENFAFLGQFCELPHDTVFTVEYSVRSAQTAVYGICDQPRPTTPIYKGFSDFGVVTSALKTILRNGS